MEKTFAENKQKLAAGDVGRIDAALEQARQAVKGDDVEAIRRATAELQTASHAMAEALYKGEQKTAARRTPAASRTPKSSTPSSRRRSND